MQRKTLAALWYACLAMAAFLVAVALAMAPVLPVSVWRLFMGASTAMACVLAAVAGTIHRALDRIEAAQKDEETR